jgi:hypothetical protein
MIFMKNFFILLLISFPGLMVAQTAATNTGILYISNSADIFYAGSDFTNNTGSALTNHGQLYVRGNLSNNQSTMTTGTGTLYLNGSAAQSVNGSQPFRTFHLNSNNSNGITLNNNLSISGTHTFSSGIITTSATPNYLVYEAGSTYAGAADSRHVNGWIKKIGSTNFVFPVGNGIVQRTVALNSLSAASEFDVKYFPNTPNVYQTQTPIWTVDNNEYWSIQKVSGGSASVAMNWDFSKVYFPNYIIADIRAAGYNGSLWINHGGSASGNAATTGSITSASVSSFNLFTFGTISYVLPLSLTFFEATRVNDYTEIRWTIESETNADRFEVERSDDGNTFFMLSGTPGRNSGFTEQYKTKDHRIINGIAFYRLRMIDKAGNSTLSKVVSVRNDKRRDLILLLNNPVRDHIKLAVTGNLAGSFTYKIHTMNGQLVQEGKVSLQNEGQYTIALDKVREAGTYS